MYEIVEMYKLLTFILFFYLNINTIFPAEVVKVY